jgi:hypothetical protein
MGIGEGKATREPKANALEDRLAAFPFRFPSLAFNPCESQRRVRANGGAPAQQEPNPRRPSAASCLGFVIIARTSLPFPPVVRHRHHHHHYHCHHCPHRCSCKRIFQPCGAAIDRIVWDGRAMAATKFRKFQAETRGFGASGFGAISQGFEN